eukprot:TRINITY_DN9347_c0_g1_i5.p1 TRINITY_DN9347_c0_g1~~TRINITY_DN9347_c0_g1_i5.p1  ORF type:complete len:238 (+),score=68.14 TRINITY_DN9347_c0_g1_i5:194-907(+)
MSMDLFSLRNQLYTGNYQQVVTEAAAFNARGDDALAQERDILLYRAYIAMGQQFLAIQKIPDSASFALRSVKLLATFSQSPTTAGDAACETLDEWMGNPQAAKDQTVLLMAATILNTLGKYEDTLKYIHDSTDIELMATLVQTFLYMDRMDLAEKQFATMQRQEDDATLTQLASTWINLAKGSEKIKEALFTLVDISEKYGTSTMIFNGMATAHMGQCEFEDAEACVNNALQLVRAF